MAMNLNEFRNALIHGGARPSLFNMLITWPQIIPQGVAAAAALPFLCSVSEIPAYEIGSVAVPFMGRKLNFAGDRTYSPLTVTIINDEDFKIRAALEAWQRAITGLGTVVSSFSGGITADSYATDGLVQQFSRNDNGNGGVPIKSYKYIGMFPTNIGPIALDWNSNDQIEVFTVQFVYQWADSVDPSTGQATENI